MTARLMRRGTPVRVVIDGVVWAGRDQFAAYVLDTSLRIEIALPEGCGRVVIAPAGGDSR